MVGGQPRNQNGSISFTICMESDLVNVWKEYLRLLIWWYIRLLSWIRFCRSSSGSMKKIREYNVYLSCDDLCRMFLCVILNK